MKMSWIIWLGIAAMAGLMLAVGFGAGLAFTTEIMVAFGFLLDAYVGGDQFAAVMRTRKMPEGEKFAGNRNKLIAIVFAAFALMVEAFTIQIVAGNAGRSVDLPSMGLFLIFLLGAALLTSGEKIKTAFEDVAE